MSSKVREGIKAITRRQVDAVIQLADAGQPTVTNAGRSVGTAPTQQPHPQTAEQPSRSESPRSEGNVHETGDNRSVDLDPAEQFFEQAFEENDFDDSPSQLPRPDRSRFSLTDKQKDARRNLYTIITQKIRACQSSMDDTKKILQQVPFKCYDVNLITGTDNYLIVRSI